MQALLCVYAVAEGMVQRQAPLGVREALLEEPAAPLLGYLLSLTLRVRFNCQCHLRAQLSCLSLRAWL